MGQGSSIEDDEEWRGADGEVYMLIVALDYLYSKMPLSAKQDAQKMLDVALNANVPRENISVVTDDTRDLSIPTRRSFVQYVRAVASRPEAGDWLVIYYAGHGKNVPDHNGDEVDGQDEAFVLPTRTGDINETQAWLVDDDFAELLDHSVRPGVRILVICDCCHSATICDIDSYVWRHEIFSITACKDDQEAEELPERLRKGKGGLLTECIVQAVNSFSHGELYSIGELYERVEETFEELADEDVSQIPGITWRGSQDGLDMTAWPLCRSQTLIQRFGPAQQAPLESLLLTSEHEPFTPSRPSRAEKPKSSSRQEEKSRCVIS